MSLKLSKNAEKLLARVKEGRWYMAYEPGVPKAMKELEDAGLVRIVGRPMVIAAAYVPAKGYVPYRGEKFK